MRALVRPIYIGLIALRYGLDGLLLDSLRRPKLTLLSRIISFGRNLDAPRGERLRLALEQLGPIFVKFGQMLSTRRAIGAPAPSALAKDAS